MFRDVTNSYELQQRQQQHSSQQQAGLGHPRLGTAGATAAALPQTSPAVQGSTVHAGLKGMSSVQGPAAAQNTDPSTLQAAGQHRPPAGKPARASAFSFTAAVLGSEGRAGSSRPQPPSLQQVTNPAAAQLLGRQARRAIPVPPRSAAAGAAASGRSTAATTAGAAAVAPAVQAVTPSSSQAGTDAAAEALEADGTPQEMHLCADGVVVCGAGGLPVPAECLGTLKLYAQPVLLRNTAGPSLQERRASAAAAVALAMAAPHYSPYPCSIPCPCRNPQEPQPWQLNEHGLIVLGTPTQQAVDGAATAASTAAPGAAAVQSGGKRRRLASKVVVVPPRAPLLAVATNAGAMPAAASAPASKPQL